MKSLNQDITYMQKALAMALEGQYTAHPNPMVGCVIVKDNVVLAKGAHYKAGQAHAEINALKQANAEGATCYVTLEPCAHTGKTGPCVNALIEAKVKRVVIANIDPNPLVKGKGIEALLKAGIDVHIGVLEKEAAQLNKGFYSRVIRQRPYVRAKIGMSLDGKVAMISGESQWITSTESRENAHRWRAKSGAIITGSNTVLADDCRLTVRNIEALKVKENTFSQPLRVVIDSQLRVPSDKAIFSQEGTTLIATTKNNATTNAQDNVVVLPSKEGKIDLNALMQFLAEKEINDVLVEAGPTLIGALLKQGLIDELLVYIAPLIMGNDARSFATLSGFDKLANCLKGSFSTVEKNEHDLFAVLKLTEDEFLL